MSIVFMSPRINLFLRKAHLLKHLTLHKITINWSDSWIILSVYIFAYFITFCEYTHTQILTRELTDYTCTARILSHGHRFESWSSGNIHVYQNLTVFQNDTVDKRLTVNKARTTHISKMALIYVMDSIRNCVIPFFLNK